MAENGTLFVKIASIMLMTSSKQGKLPLFKSDSFTQKQHGW